ncbi:MAG TPA: MMPL family transporter [Actinomycetota bacterium]|nr:MMPL family transporter [Actinomycetota bacterium]
MALKVSPQSLSRVSARRPWLTIALWVVLVAAAGVTSSRLLDGALTTEFNFNTVPEAERAARLVEDRLRGPQGTSEIFIVRSDSVTARDPAFRSEVGELQSDVVSAVGRDHIQAVVDPYRASDRPLISEDGSTVLLPVVLEGEGDDVTEHVGPIERVVEEHAGDEGFDVFVFGGATIGEDFNRIAEEDLARGEGFGIMVALVVLVAVFGAVVAGVVPIVMGIASIAVAIGLVALVGQIVEFSFFVTNMISMMGLAVGIDYSLFIVSRYREERRNGRERLDAISVAGGTASRAVFFSGMTVVLALAGMLIVPTSIFRSLAAGAIFVVVAAVLASITLLPALLSLLGDKVNALRVFRRRSLERVEGGRRTFWDRVTHGVMRRPVASLVVGAGLLLAAAFSYLDIDTGFSGVSTMPDKTQSKQAFLVLREEFSGGLNSPVEVVVDGDVTAQVEAGIEELRRAMAADGGFGPSTVEVNEAGDLAVVSAAVAGDPSGSAAVAAVERLRDGLVPRAFSGADADVLVGGETALSKDFFDLTDRYTPIVFVFVLGLSFLLLTVVFRSIVVPLKAIVMNLLSVGAAYGLIVLVCQKGVGADLFGFHQVEAIEAWLPLFLFSVLFGLSMDYHVFLLSRIRERFDHTHDNTGSVAYGLRTTAGLITGAALIMVAVFGGFAAGDLVSFQQMGFGLAVAVFIDATIVRSVLVPASMKLLGDRNWYLPRWLRWLPQMHVEGREPEAPARRAPERAGVA